MLLLILLFHVTSYQWDVAYLQMGLGGMEMVHETFYGSPVRMNKFENLWFIETCFQDISTVLHTRIEVLMNSPLKIMDKKGM